MLVGLPKGDLNDLHVVMAVNLRYFTVFGICGQLCRTCHSGWR